ncbi:MAG: hypothetical protein K0Q64_1127 [Nitrobacter vulgaris]|nr:hypothetical protein [Nitrobacter vulgaris]
MNAVRPVLLRRMLAGVVLGTLTGTAVAADVGVSRQPAKAVAQPLVDWPVSILAPTPGSAAADRSRQSRTPHWPPAATISAG